MDAADLAEPVSPLRTDDAAVAALRVLAVSGLPGVVVQAGHAYVVIPASQVLRVALPRYVLDDPALGRVWDESTADQLASELVGRSVADLVAALDRHQLGTSHVVDRDATVVQLAAVMAAAHLPLVAVVDHGALLGVVTANRLIRYLLT